MTARETPATARRRHKGHFDRGAAAVEMALVMPLLLLMIFGIIDFSRVFNAELQLSQAAREGVRLASLRPQLTSSEITTAAKQEIQDRAILAAPNPAFGGPLVRDDVIVDPPYCIAKPLDTDYITVSVHYNFNGIGPWFSNRLLEQKAVMRCSG